LIIDALIENNLLEGVEVLNLVLVGKVPGSDCFVLFGKLVALLFFMGIQVHVFGVKLADVV